MKITVVSGSPREGSTARILREMLKTPRTQGHEIVEHRLHHLRIHYCTGCRTCSRNGVCMQDDDVSRIVADIFASQYVVIASPSYWGDVTGQMKVFIDRCTPYGNTNQARKQLDYHTKGIGVAVRAGPNKEENRNLLHTMEHFLGHLDIPLVDSFTAEGIRTLTDLEAMPQILRDAFVFGKRALT